ncbi:MAG: cation:proton antiporter [Euzebya sp.]
MTLVLATGTVSADDLLRFWISLGILLLAAKLLGYVARRMGQPAVVGELSAGVLLGPTLLGRLAPDATAWLFPSDGNVSAMISAVAWLGVVLLLAVTGFEIDLSTLKRLGRVAITTSAASLIIPIGLGLALGVMLPAVFAGAASGNALPLFMGVALGISALPVVAKVLRELQLAKAGVGQVMLAAGMVNDIVGWALLGVVAGVVSNAGSPVVGLTTALVGSVLVIVGGLTLGQRGVDGLLRVIRRSDDDQASLLGASVIVIIAAGALTQALGVEAVLGAFVAGIVLSRSPLGGRQIEKPLSQMADQILAPVFFATAGLRVDLFAIIRPPLLYWTVAIIAVAITGKVVGGWLGARLGGFDNRDSLAVGIGLNARGALEIVVASVGLSLGVLSGEAYSAVVVMAVVTSLMAPPLLTIVLGLPPMRRAQEGDASVFAGMRTALMPTRGGASSVLAGRVADAVLPTTASLTALTVHPYAEDSQAGRAAARSLSEHVHRRLRWRDHVAEDTAAEVLAESVLGYDLLAVGATATQLQDDPIGQTLERIISSAAIPVLLVRTAPGVDPGEIALTRVAVGVTGSETGTAAVDLGIRVAARHEAALTLMHVIDRPDVSSGPTGGSPQLQTRALGEADKVLTLPRQRALDEGVRTDITLLRSPMVAEELVSAAVASGAELLVIGAARHSDGTFLGHIVTHLLMHAPMSVAIMITSG